MHSHAIWAPKREREWEWEWEWEGRRGRGDNTQMHFKEQ